MIYGLFAEIILIIHVCFILFVLFGGFLLLRRRWLWKIHIPAVVWGFAVEYFVWICPLTTWENYFRNLAGQAGYTGGFIDYYLTSIIYLDISAEFHTFIAFLLVLINLAIYTFVFSAHKSKN